MFEMLEMYASDPHIELIFGPGSPAFPDLDPRVRDDGRAYVTHPSPVDGIYFTRLTINHFGGTCPLRAADDQGGTDPKTLRVRGTDNVHVVDASIQPKVVPGHPVATIMACAQRAAALLLDVVR